MQLNSKDYSWRAGGGTLKEMKPEKIEKPVFHGENDQSLSQTDNIFHDAVFERKDWDKVWTWNISKRQCDILSLKTWP